MWAHRALHTSRTPCSSVMISMLLSEGDGEGEREKGRSEEGEKEKGMEGGGGGARGREEGERERRGGRRGVRGRKGGCGEGGGERGGVTWSSRYIAQTNTTCYRCLSCKLCSSEVQAFDRHPVGSY